MNLNARLARARASAVDAGAESTVNAPVVPLRPNPRTDLRREIHKELLSSLGAKLYDSDMKVEQLQSKIRKTLGEVLEREASRVSAAERKQIVAEIADDILGLGPIEPLLHDRTVTEVMVNGPDRVYVERDGKLTLSDVRFVDDAHLRRIIEKIVGGVGRRIDESQPYVDARLADGSRVNAVIPPVALDGASLTIRKFAADPMSVADLVQYGTLSAEVAMFLEACVRGRLNVLISGGTGVGKTTTLDVLSGFIPSDERIVTIEDAAELQLQQPHVVRLEHRPPNIEGRGEVTIRDLVKNALRMRPDRIVVGEVRGAESLDMLQAMNTGHDGSMSTIHANTPRDALARIETMVLLAGIDLPVRAIRQQTSSALQLVIQLARLKDGTRRITHVTEVLNMEGELISLQDLFLFEYSAGVDEQGRAKGELQPTGIRPTFAEHLRDLGIDMGAELFTPRAGTNVRRSTRKLTR